MKKLLSIISLILLLGVSYSIKLTYPYIYDVSITERRDGDTFEGYIGDEYVAVRIADINCAELGSKKGDLLKVVFNKYLIKKVTIKTYGRSYDRIVADVFLNGVNFGDLLTNNKICKVDTFNN